jgi:hypothetical protein
LGWKTGHRGPLRAYDGRARTSGGTDAPKDDDNLRPHIWPGLALAGGVLIAAVIALLLLAGRGGGPSDGQFPGGGDPGDTRLFPGTVIARPPQPATRRHARPRVVPPPVGVAPGGSAAESQYDATGNRGVVLSGP